MTVVRLGSDAARPAPPARRVVLDGPRFAVLRATAPAVPLPSPFDGVGDPGAHTEAELDRARADLLGAGVLVEVGDRVEVHPAILAGLLTHSGPDAALRLDVRRFREVSVLRAAVSGSLCSSLRWSLEAVPGADGSRVPVGSDPVELRAGPVTDLVGLLTAEVDGDVPRTPREPATVDAARATAVLAGARSDDDRDDAVAALPTPLDRLANGLPGSLTLRIGAAGATAVELRWVHDGEGWWQVGPGGRDADGRPQLRLDPVVPADLSATATSALAGILGRPGRG